VSNSDLWRTPLWNKHLALGAKMTSFAGWEMPVYYTGIISEHRHVRTSAGIFDLGHMGEIEINGPNATNFLRYVLPTEVVNMTPGDIRYSMILNKDGGVIDDILVYRLADKYLLVVNASNREKDFQWLSMHAQPGVQVVDRSDELSMLAVQGPKSVSIISSVSDDLMLGALFYYQFKQTMLNDVPVILSRTGYTGEDGFEIICPRESVECIWDLLMDLGSSIPLNPIGLGARDTLRLEMGYCLYGNELDESRNPYEAGISWAVDMGGSDFIGRDALFKYTHTTPARKLIGISLVGRGIARQNYRIFDDKTGDEIGVVTSGTMSPTLNKPIAMGYVETPALNNHDRLNVDIRGNLVEAEIVKRPFVKSKVYRKR
jgi:aminomethyltransferase